MTWRYTDGHEEFVHDGSVLLSHKLPSPKPVDPQVVLESDLLCSVAALSDPSEILRLVEPWDLVVWKDWWVKARSEGVPEVPEVAKMWGMELPALAARFADRVLALAEARDALRDAQKAQAEAVEHLREVTRYV